MGDRHLARQFAGRAILVDVNPLFVAGCFSEGVDAVLAYFDPLARANFGTGSGFEFIEVLENSHQDFLRMNVPAQFEVR